MLALLPLDDRPCNLRFPAEIAAIGADDLIAPPRDMLGRFNIPGAPAELAKWLEQLPEVSALIVSVDMLAYGGLVASRKTFTNLETALERLEVLKQWRRARPHVPIYAFNILMRLAITITSDESVKHYYNVMRYARLADEVKRFSSPEKEAELAEVIAALPPAILEEYHGARTRNHTINMKMLEWVSEGVFEALLITQEDCTEFGLHRQEQDEILALAQKLNVGDKFALHPGADEAALSLLARHWDMGVRFQIHWSNPDAKRRIAIFEDVPYENSLRSHIAAMGGQIVECDEDTDVHLFVNAPEAESQKNETPELRAARCGYLNTFIENIECALQSGAHVALCDVAFPNGADNLLLSLLEERGTILPRLMAFGGWNTAGNTTGTVLAECAAVWRGAEAPESAQLNRRFVFERLLDDWYYQSNLRPNLESAAYQNGFSPLNMNGKAATIEQLARPAMEERARELAQQFGQEVELTQVALPWGRTFEIEVSARLI